MKFRGPKKQNKEELKDLLNGTQNELKRLKSHISSGGSTDNSGEIKHMNGKEDEKE